MKNKKSKRNLKAVGCISKNCATIQKENKAVQKSPELLEQENL